MKSKLLIALGLAAMVVLAQPSATSPEGTARAFYTLDLKLKLSGLPDGRKYKQITPYLSSGLQALIVKAQAQQNRCIKAHPDEKGPWIEGDMFTSNFEGYTKFSVNAPANAASPGKLAVDFEYSDKTDGFKWQDQVVLIQENGHWVIDDILYRQSEGFGNGFGTGLRASLSSPGC